MYNTSKIGSTCKVAMEINDVTLGLPGVTDSVSTDAYRMSNIIKVYLISSKTFLFTGSLSYMINMPLWHLLQ